MFSIILICYYVIYYKIKQKYNANRHLLNIVSGVDREFLIQSWMMPGCKLFCCSQYFPTNVFQVSIFMKVTIVTFVCDTSSHYINSVDESGGYTALKGIFLTSNVGSSAYEL